MGMSDRQGTVRTQDATRAGEQPSPSETQVIPTTGAQPAQTGAQRAQAAPVGVGKAGGGPVKPPAPGVVAPAPAAVAPGAGAAAVAPPAAAGRAATDSAPAKKAQGTRPVKSAGRGPRRARLQLRHIDIWSAFKISLVLSIALFFIWMVAIGILYGVLSGLGVFTTLNDLFGQLGSATGSGGKSEVITPGIVFGGAAVIGAINVVLMTALCTVGTFIYNLCSDLVGGLEVTLSERD
jgi:hypothetical protein